MKVRDLFPLLFWSGAINKSTRSTKRLEWNQSIVYWNAALQYIVHVVWYNVVHRCCFLSFRFLFFFFFFMLKNLMYLLHSSKHTASVWCWPRKRFPRNWVSKPSELLFILFFSCSAGASFLFCAFLSMGGKIQIFVCRESIHMPW